MAQRKPNTARYVIDATDYTAVARCTLCHWRGFSHSKHTAYRQVADHLVRAHDDYKGAADARRASHVVGSDAGSPL